MTGVSTLGPWPGIRLLEMQQVVLGELANPPAGVSGLPAIVRLPERGPEAGAVPRAAALLTDLPIELGPHGWKLADRPGMDQSRATALLREDLDTLAIAGHGYAGPLVVEVSGPWSLCAELYLARGDRVLSDPGAVRDVVAALADGIGVLVAAMRTAVPGAEPVVVLREPILTEVLDGAIASFSGHSRLWSVPAQDVGAGLRHVVDAAHAAGSATVVAHAGRRFATHSFAVLVESGADAVGVAAGAVRGAQWEHVAAAVEQGQAMWFGLPQVQRGPRPDPRALADLVARPWTAVGLPAGLLSDVVVHCETSTHRGVGPAFLDPAVVRAALGSAVRVAAELAERAADG